MVGLTLHSNLLDEGVEPEEATIAAALLRCSLVSSLNTTYRLTFGP